MEKIFLPESDLGGVFCVPTTFAKAPISVVFAACLFEFDKLTFSIYLLILFTGAVWVFWGTPEIK